MISIEYLSRARRSADRGRARKIAAATTALAVLACGIAQAGSLRFFGNGRDDIDRVKIRIDDPANSNPGPPADIGNGAFTIEFWIKGSASDNNNNVRCGAVYGWIDGDIVIDRDRYELPRSWGLSLGQGRVAFGVNVDNVGIVTVCGNRSVLDNNWHHVAVTRATNGTISIFIDGTLDESAAGPMGDLSYPDNGQPQGNNCGGAPCINSDPFLVIGAEKHDAVPGQLAFNGFFDELRLSNSARYTGNFTPSTVPLTADANTVALYHFDEATSGNCTSGTVINDADGGASNGECRFGGSPGGPVWSADSPFGGGTSPGTLQFSGATASAGEGAGSVTLTVTRTSGTSGAASVAYASANGTATAGSDYTAVSGTLNWAAGSGTSQPVSVPILDDSEIEGPQTFTVALSTPTGATLGSPSTLTVTIADDDSPGNLQLSSATYAVTEGTPTRVVTVARLNGDAGQATVNYATSDGTATQGLDYTAATGTLSWNSGEGGNKTFPVSILDDSQIENDETFSVTISGASGATLIAPTTATITISDNDGAGTLQFSAPSYSVGEGGGTQTVTVSRMGGSSGAVSVNYATSDGSATAGSDYTAASGALSWNNGETGAKTFAVPIANDVADESNESFTVTLSGPTGGATVGTPASATVTINDDDSPPGNPGGGDSGGGRTDLYLIGAGLLLALRRWRRSAGTATRAHT